GAAEGVRRGARALPGADRRSPVISGFVTLSARRFGAWCAGLLLAGVSVVVGCRLADTDGVTPVPQILALLPWLLAPTALALFLALLTHWRAGTVWSVLVLALLAWYIEP